MLFPFLPVTCAACTLVTRLSYTCYAYLGVGLLEHLWPLYVQGWLLRAEIDLCMKW